MPVDEDIDDISEVLREVRRIELRTRGLVQESVGGEYHSCFKGQGVDFDDFREYQPGDEVRSIDWNVTARMGHPFIKKFVEERELSVFLVVDVSASGVYGSSRLIQTPGRSTNRRPPRVQRHSKPGQSRAHSIQRPSRIVPSAQKGFGTHPKANPRDTLLSPKRKIDQPNSRN